MLNCTGSTNHFRIERGQGKQIQLQVLRYDRPIRFFYGNEIHRPIMSYGMYLFTKACKRFAYKPKNVSLMTSKEFACYFLVDGGTPQCVHDIYDEDVVAQGEIEREAASTAVAAPPATFSCVTGPKSALLVLAIGIALVAASLPAITRSTPLGGEWNR